MRTFFRSLVVTLLLTATAWAAEPLQPGEALPVFSLKDQHEQPFTFAPGPRVVVVSFAMTSGKQANAFFARQPADFLAQKQALFIANIYGMPAIGRFFALPKMKKYPHRILLGDDEHLLDRFPQQPGKLTVLNLDPLGKITAIAFVDAEKDLPTIFIPSP
jgi:hypothetical protein